MTVSNDDPEYSFQAILQDLDTELTLLKTRLDRFRLRFDFALGDLSLYGFILQVWEAASATRQLVMNGDLGHASFPSTRSAFEAAEDAFLLATSPDYNATGARIRVYERFEFADVGREVQFAFQDGEAEMQPADYSRMFATIERDADRVNRLSEGQGQVLRAAFEYFLPIFEAANRQEKRARYPGHWSEMSRRRIALELEERTREPKLAATLIAAYADLSRHSHPRLRFDNWEKYLDSDGTHRFTRSERPRRISAGTAHMAVKLANQACEIVRPMPPDA